jgi:pimeloyl-ACP methyl ester carboxylesterase
MPALEHKSCRLSYDVRGAGPPVVFIQGAGVHGSGWKPQVDSLSSRFACLSFDNRGIGESRPKAAAITVETMADDAAALMDATGWESADVVGHSLGGPIALQLALTSLRRVRSLSLLCTFAYGKAAAPLTMRMMLAGMRSRVGTRRMRRHGFLGIILPPDELKTADGDALAESLAPVFGHDLADQPPIVSDQLRAMRAFNVTAQLGKLASIPTLVVSATHDMIASPPLGQKLAAGIPGARFVEIPNAAHGLPIHSADVVNKLLVEHFLAVASPLYSGA